MDRGPFDSCFSFQGKFFHFLAINRHREIEYNLLYIIRIITKFCVYMIISQHNFPPFVLLCVSVFRA